MDAQIEIDPNFEPQTRVRSNTWPCRPREVLQDAQCSPVSDESTSDSHHHEQDHIKSEALGLAKKTSSRRNAWGNLSYADLITKAIQSSPEQRLTLSQIYDWMVQNVPYFKDKGDSTSSAGWKNSIRHNLSLHSRFMRIQNEGTGKSSWWVLNPDAKPGKTPRRRAGSMETKSYEKRRGRVRKKVDALRAALENSNSPTSTTDDFTDSPLGFQLSPEFRPRASSNASSCGRLSPIQAGIEPDLHDSQVPPMSPIPWGTELDSADSYETLGQSDGLVDVLLDSMKLADRNNLTLSDNTGGLGLMEQGDIEMLADSGLQQQLISSNNGHLTELSSLSQYNEQSANFDNAQYRNLPAPPAYPGDSIRHQSSNQQGMDQMTLQNGGNGVYRDISDIGLQGRPSNMSMYSQQNSVYSPQEAMMLQARISPASSQLSVNTQSPQLTSPSRSPQGHQQISPNYGNQGNFSGPNQQSPQDKQMSPQQLASRQVANSQQQRSLLQQCLEAPPSESLLRAALTQKNQAYQMSLAPSQSTQSQSYSSPQPPPPQYTNIRYDGQQINARLASPSQQRQMPSMNSNNINNNVVSAQSVNRNISMMSGGAILQQQSRQQQQRNMVGQNISDISMSQQLQTGLANTGQMPTGNSIGNASGNSLNEINDTVNFDDLSVEEILNYELTREGNLDFTETFDPVNNSVTTSSETQNLVR